MNMQLVGEASQETIEGWKKKFGEIYQVSDGASVCYLRKVDRQVMRAAYSFLSRDRVRYVEVIVENCFLGGDESFKTDDGKFLSLVELIPELTTFKELELKKL